MSLFDYTVSKHPGVLGAPFYALIMAAMRRADSENIVKLRSVFPDVYDELRARYDAPGGVLPSDPEAASR